jgi:hypothetical protein
LGAPDPDSVWILQGKHNDPTKRINLEISLFGEPDVLCAMDSSLLHELLIHFLHLFHAKKLEIKLKT